MSKELVKSLIVQSSETLMCMPNAFPRASVNAMASFWSQVITEYPPERTSYKRRPSPKELDDMETVWKWINRLPNESDRKLLYAWGYIKARKGARLKGFAAKNCMSEGGLRKKIDKLCQSIANNEAQVLNNWKQ